MMIRRVLETFKNWDLANLDTGELRKEILNFILITTCATCFLVTIINIFNKRPLSNILLPAGLGVLIFILYRFSSKDALRYPVKLTFMVLISLAYIPVAWLTSPGSSSAMPMYTL